MNASNLTALYSYYYFPGYYYGADFFGCRQTNGSVQGLILNGNGFRRLQQLQTPLFIS